VQAEPHAHSDAIRPVLALVRTLNLDGRRDRVASPRERVKNASPCVSISRTMRRCVARRRSVRSTARRTCVYRASPSRLRRLVLLSMSLNTKVTVPDGRLGMCG